MSTSRDVITGLLPATELLPAHVEMLHSIPVEDANALVRHLFHECNNSPRARAVLPALVKVVEGGDRAIAPWVREIVEVYAWLEARGDRARFADVLEYVSCAYEGSSSHAGHSIHWYLEQYGFEKRL